MSSLFPHSYVLSEKNQLNTALSSQLPFFATGAIESFCKTTFPQQPATNLKPFVALRHFGMCMLSSVKLCKKCGNYLFRSVVANVRLSESALSRLCPVY